MSNDCESEADKAVRRVFAILGVDIDRPSAVAEFQEDLRFNSRLRKRANRSLLTFVSTVTAAIVAYIWMQLTGGN